MPQKWLGQDPLLLSSYLQPPHIALEKEEGGLEGEREAGTAGLWILDNDMEAIC